jgi:uncharacterized membrane protein YfcA
VFFLSFRKKWGLLIAGGVAGGVAGLFGAGGGMVLVPLLTKMSDLEDRSVFPSSVCMILPICVISLFMSINVNGIPLPLLFSYLAGSAAGALIAGLTAKKLPTLWLHRGLGLLILWGGIRYLW